MRNITYFILMALCLCSCVTKENYGNLRKELKEFVADKDAEIGIAVIIDGKDTVSVNGNKEFPMLSVYKFPIALALADHYRANELNFDHPIAVCNEDLHLDTYSPMTEKLLASDKMVTDTLMMPTRELLAYMLQQSDNNASDIVVKGLMGISNVMRILNKSGIEGVNIISTEAEMHENPELSYENSTTPLAMARLFDKFDREGTDSLSLEIKRLLETCKTGESRLPKPLLATNAVIGHKTGTGFTLPDGRLMAVNDAGYVHLPNGHHYSIAVFIANSCYDMEKTESLIAEISEIVLNSITE